MFTIPRAVIGLLCLLTLQTSHAAVSLSSTRVIIAKGTHEANLIVRNHGNDDVMLQSWLESDPRQPGAHGAFVVTPTVARLNGQAKQQLRVLFQGAGLPTDRESVVWLNVQEIPKRAEKANTLQLAVRQKIKVFYRPEALDVSANDAPAHLQWRVVEDRTGRFLQVNNPGVFHVSLAELSLGMPGLLDTPDTKSTMAKSTMIAPGETARINLGSLDPRATKWTLTFKAINDYGGQTIYDALVNTEALHQATVRS